MASRQTDSGNGETAVPSANVRRRLAKLVARGIYPLMDFLEKESCDSGVMKQYEPFTPQQPLDTDGIVRQVIGRLKDELPATADRGRVEAADVDRPRNRGRICWIFLLTRSCSADLIEGLWDRLTARALGCLAIGGLRDNPAGVQ